MTNECKLVVAVKGIIVKDEKILIIKRSSNDKIGADTWECVGGKIEFGEDLEEALMREVKEEVGLTITVDKLLYATTFQTNPTRQVVILTYLCTSKNDKIILSPEHSDFKWVSTEESQQFLTPEIINDFKKNNIFSLKELL
ncbi:NUDIX hydrolase [Clostridium sp. DL1XJH146]